MYSPPGGRNDKKVARKTRASPDVASHSKQLPLSQRKGEGEEGREKEEGKERKVEAVDN